MNEELLQNWIERQLDNLAEGIENDYYYCDLEAKAVAGDCAERVRRLKNALQDQARFETAADAKG